MTVKELKQQLEDKNDNYIICYLSELDENGNPVFIELDFVHGAVKNAQYIGISGDDYEGDIVVIQDQIMTVIIGFIIVFALCNTYTYFKCLIQKDCIDDLYERIAFLQKQIDEINK